ncbi:hypothetical protein H0A36_28880, partial [Endozoicomonas sp. SM1973]
MLRKLVVLFSATLFFSSQIIANTDDVIEFLPGNQKFTSSYFKGRMKDPLSSLSAYEECVLGLKESGMLSMGVRPYTIVSYDLELLPVKEKRFRIGEILNSNSRITPLAHLFKVTRNYMTEKEHKELYPNTPELFCDGYTFEQSNSEGFFGDFNNDGLGDVIYQIKYDYSPYSLLIFYGTQSEIKTTNLLGVGPAKYGKYPFAKALETIDGISLKNVTIKVQDRNKDGRDDLLITRPGAPDLIAFAAPDGSFPKAEVDTGIGKYNGPSLDKSRFCNRALLTQHPDENPSTVLFDDVCRTAYVSPPATGTTEVTTLTPDPDNATF